MIPPTGFSLYMQDKVRVWKQEKSKEQARIDKKQALNRLKKESKEAFEKDIASKIKKATPK
jgi:hypothetical protein